MFEKPLGMRDTLPSLYETKRVTRSGLTEVIRKWGYQFLETPTLEFYETVGVQSAILDQQLFKLLDQQGHTLVLRPDMTAPIARIAASRLYNGKHPLRLAYAANVFRAQQREGGRPAEFEQVGIELIGDGTANADAEAIALMITSLKEAGLQSFKVAVGHIRFANALFEEVLGNQERADTAKRFLYEKNYVGYREHVKSLPLSSIDQQRLLGLLQLRGGIETAEAAAGMTSTREGKEAVAEIHRLWEILEDYGLTDYVKLDFNLVSHMSYYTGILFEVYASDVGYPIGNGGRYDNLFQEFQTPAPATGFGLILDRVLEALGKQNSETEKCFCVIYSPERRAEAIRHAISLREEGKLTVLQDLAGVEDVDAFSKTFSDVTYFIGSRRDNQE
nr:ATP phosphoribosyltransferase regulatory subunit [Metabacillus lacus]